MFHVRPRLAAACLAGTLLVVGGCADSPSVPGLRLEKIAVERGPSFSVDGAGAVVSALIGPQGGELTTASGHRLVFPAGALPHPTEIRMRDDGEFVGVRLQPHGLRFPVGRGPALTLRHGGMDLSDYAYLQVVYVGEDGEILEVLPTRSGDDAVLADLRHFSGYLIGGGRHQ